MAKKGLEEIFKAGHIAENSFEAQLGLLVHKWIILVGLDVVIQSLDDEIQALELRRDLENDKG